MKISPASRPRSPRRLKMNGWLSGGKGTRLWLDGDLAGAKDPPASAKVLPEAVRIRWQGRWLELKPGQVARKNPKGGIRIQEFDHDSD